MKLSIAETEPPTLEIHADGEVPTGGWTDGHLIPYVYITPPVDGIYDFDFVAQPPSGISNQMVTPIEAKTYQWYDYPEGLKGVRVHSSTNSIEVLLN